MSAQTAYPNPQDSQREHILSLKVMRLSKPTLGQTHPVFYENSSMISNALESLASTELIAKQAAPTQKIPLRDLGVSSLLSIPSSFGIIYLGETFDFYLCINNDSTQYAYNVSVRAELQTSAQRFVLIDTIDKPLATLESSKASEFVAQHEIKELGVHTLVCTVGYMTEEKEKKSFRKYYKFQVMNPLAVKTKVNNMADGKVFLEVQVHNVAERVMYLERMKFEPGDIFTYNDLNHVVEECESESETRRGDTKDILLDVGNTTDAEDKKDTANVVGTVSSSSISAGNDSISKKSIFGAYNYLNPQDIRQYLYMLTPKPSADDRIARTTNALGKLDIIWRSSFGETGRLQTSQLTRKPLLLEDIDLSVVSVPDVVRLESPFTISCKVRNRTTSLLKIVVTAVKNKMGAILLAGASSKYLGELSPNGVVQFDMEFFPLAPGLQRVGGLRVLDVIGGYSKDVEHLTDIFVRFDD
ncbi:5103_t:CDS:1 [Paraglomus brasilianum]|uniref:5103_t:CDS:1 n=1 Tax=Paraglomus brasilianum TaxID=144538 RepID=A0A9N8VLD5_9GLOM|nr:5103_t:CDS:1 [Paraglomus brasilianum]